MADIGGAAHGHHADPAPAQHRAAAAGQDLERGLVAAALDQYDLLRAADIGQIDAHPGHVHGVRTADQPPQGNSPSKSAHPGRR